MSYSPPVIVDLAAIDALLSKGMTRVTVHDNGKLASADFAEPDTQPKNPHPVETPVRRTGGRLVPRVGSDSA